MEMSSPESDGVTKTGTLRLRKGVRQDVGLEIQRGGKVGVDLCMVFR